MKESYKDQVRLMLRVLPEVAKETCFALHGGTAINLFVRDMPRLSVDIDLTYLPVEDRETSLAHIREALQRIKTNVERTMNEVIISEKISNNEAKLFISHKGIVVKLEVNLIKRGNLQPPVPMELCMKAQNEFGSYCKIQVVSFGELYGGKVCAAMDRQHPRDLFDVWLLMQHEGFSDSIKEGFILFTVSGNGLIRSMINPNHLDQRTAFEHNFEGMTDMPFNYEEFMQVRNNLIETIIKTLSPSDKAFLMSIKELKPRWDIYDFERFPAVQWKLRNLSNHSSSNPEKYQSDCENLRALLQD